AGALRLADVLRRPHAIRVHNHRRERSGTGDRAERLPGQPAPGDRSHHRPASAYLRDAARSRRRPGAQPDHRRGSGDAMQPLEATAMIRRLVGLALAIQALDTTLALRRILAPDVLRTPFFDGMPLMPSSLLLPFALAWVAAAAALALGYRTRLASIVLVTVVGYALLLDQQSYANHIYLQILIVLILLLPADLAVRALRWQMTVVYLFGAIS